MNRFFLIINFNNQYRLKLSMGGQTSKIDTSGVPIEQIRASSPVQQGKFCPPFRKFRNQQLQIHDKIMRASVDVQEPRQQKIEVSQQLYTDLEDAFDCKTKDIQLGSVLYDDQYIDLKTYIAKQGGKDMTLQLRPFSKFNTYAFNNFLYEIHMNEIISKLGCINHNTIIDKYVIQTGLDVEGEQNPNTQVFVLSPIATSLSEIIKYRRENKWGWTTNEFNALASDLSNALSVLHAAKISHNDIRPCNVFYNLEKNCYQLACFGNAVKSSSSGNVLNQVRASTYYGAPELSTNKQVNLEQADIYSLGMTLLSAFYLCEPIDRKAVQDYNKKYQGSYSVMSAIREMIMPIDKRSNIDVISKRIPKGESSAKMKNLIESLQYKNSPKQKHLVSAKKSLSEGYQRLGLWNDWKDQQYGAYELQESNLDEFKKANSLYDLAKIQSCRGDLQSASQYAKSASKIYRGLGYTAYQQGNVNQSLNLFTKAIECSKYFESRNDIDTAKNLQGLALIHAEKGDYQVSKPLIRQSTSIVTKNAGKDSIDYCKIRMSQAKIESDFGQFQVADSILNQCLAISQNKTKLNQELGLKLKAQVLHELGRNSMLQSTYVADNPQLMIGKAQRYLTQSINLNQQFANNHMALANNVETFGEIQLRKQNFAMAKANFQKAEQLRLDYANESHETIPGLQKEKAQTFCNVAACQNGLGNSSQALRNYNQAIQIYRRLYGSDHNKYSAMAIGNMSKVYYKLNDKGRAKDCLKIATQILQDLLGNDDPDYLHFKHLEQTL